MIKRTQQPCDVDFTKLRFPCGVSIKYDGVKAVRFNGALVGRSFKAFRNTHLSDTYNHECFEGFEGEIVVGDDYYAADLCRKTTSAVNTLDGTPDYNWLVFDYVTDATIDLPYTQRLEALQHHCMANGLSVKIISVHTVNTMEELLAFEESALEKGAEGVIIRDVNATYKQGRVTPKSQEVLRLKRFSDAECSIIGFSEELQNNNEATTNELGLTERSAHKDNKSGKATLGSLQVRDLTTGVEFSIGSGFDAVLRADIWSRQDELLGAIVKYKFFNVGIKDKPRFPTFLGFRAAEDLEC